MQPDRAQIAEALRNTHLFRRLTPEEIDQLSAEITVTALSSGQTLFRQGDRADSFYLILEGKIKIIQRRDRTERLLSMLVAGDYFGEEALITHRRRMAAITAVTDCTLLRLSRQDFERLLGSISTLKHSLKVSLSSRRLARQVRLPWLVKDEMVYVMAREHTVFLWRNLALPALLILFSAALFIVLDTYSHNLTLAAILGGLFLAAGLGWSFWNTLDWSNDYYIITNQRVVWLEKVALLYESRNEAPLGTILSVETDTTWWGRRFGYGNITVNTFTGKLFIHHIDHPEHVAAMMDEYWGRVKSASRREETQKMEKAIRRKLNLPNGDAPSDQASPAPAQSAAPPVSTLPSPGRGNFSPPGSKFGSRLSGSARVPASRTRAAPLKRGRSSNWLTAFLHMRYESGPVVTYRKHWLILAGSTWTQTFLLLVGIAFLVWQIIAPFPWLPFGLLVILLLFYFLGISAWWMYDYYDWSNDIYQITPTQIIDIERKPFSDETKKAAPLESILSIQYSRLGIIGNLFNFGTVTIMVGGNKFLFSFVPNPSLVQQDIFRQIQERNNKKKQIEQDAESERISDWIVTYHRTATNLRDEQSPPPEEEDYS